MKLIKKLILLGNIGAIVAIGLGFLGHLHPALDTFSHFRLHLSVGLVVFGLMYMLRKWLWFGLFALVVGMFGFYASSVGTLLTKHNLAADPSKPIYSLFHFNLFWINSEREKVIDRIIELDPDLISLSEAATRWTFVFNRLEQNWPYMLHCPEWGIRGGIRFYSKWPLDLSSQYCGPFGSFAKTVVQAPDGTRFTSGSVHLRWPWPASGPKQLELIVPELEKIGENAVFAGDFNATPWSWSVKRFANVSGMKIVPGVGPTWMIEELPLEFTWIAGLPIDNVMQKGKIKVLSADTLEELGSDHLPVLVKFQIR